MPTPTQDDAIHVARYVFGIDVRELSRFPTGLCHYVYDVVLDGGRNVVVRLASNETRDALVGGIYWHDRLRQVGVPVPALLYADADPAEGFPVMVLERLLGRDLAFEYAGLTSEQKRALAAAIADIQRRVGTLPPALGFGFATSYADAGLHASWLDVVLADLERSRQRIVATGVVDARHVERVGKRVQALASYLRAIEPHPFLDDLTTKNVLVYQGRLSGIVDTDCVCFGDPLFTVALTWLALLSQHLETDYIDYWCEQMHLTGEQVQALRLYTAVFCVGFLGEIGQRFNKDEAAPIDHVYLRHLERTLDWLLAVE
jgi:aminoglycoside phosphotransferase (APT) family kinase protein